MRFKLISAILVGLLFTACSDESSQPTGLGPAEGNKPTNEAQDGAISGGGGKGVVCRDAQGAITSVQTLDLFEAKAMYGLNPWTSSDSLEAQIKRALTVIPETSRALVSAYASQVKKNLQITPPGTVLTVINDSFETMVPAGCAAEQLANYYNDKLILIAGDLWEKMDDTNRAALIIHEALYATERLFGTTDSRRTRNIVGRLFVASTSWVDSREGIPTDALNCAGVGSPLFFNAFKNSEDKWTLQFQILGKGQVMSKKIAVIYGDMFDFAEAIPHKGFRGTDKIGMEVETVVDTESVFENGDLLTIKQEWEELKDFDGKIIPGMQTSNFYLSWQSGSYPNLKTESVLINCGVEIYK